MGLQHSHILSFGALIVLHCIQTGLWPDGRSAVQQGKAFERIKKGGTKNLDDPKVLVCYIVKLFQDPETIIRFGGTRLPFGMIYPGSCKTNNRALILQI